MTLEVRNIYPLAATFKKVASLYEAAFPVEERLPLWQLSWNNLKNGQSFLTYFDQEVFIGFTYAICTDNLVYLLFLAVESYRDLPSILPTQLVYGTSKSAAPLCRSRRPTQSAS